MCCDCYEVESGHGIALGATGVWFMSLKKSDAFIRRAATDRSSAVRRDARPPGLRDLLRWTVRFS